MTAAEYADSIDKEPPVVQAGLLAVYVFLDRLWQLNNWQQQQAVALIQTIVTAGATSEIGTTCRDKLIDLVVGVTPAVFAKRVKVKTAEAGLTDKEFTDLMRANGCAVNLDLYAEAGVRPTQQVVRVVAKVLGVPPQDLDPQVR